MKLLPTSILNRAAVRHGRRVIVALVGGTVLALGFALLLLPGPAFIVIPAGLAILAVEFAWARRWLRKARGLLPGKNPFRKYQTVGSCSLPNYQRAKAAAVCRNLVPLTRTEITHPYKLHY